MDRFFLAKSVAVVGVSNSPENLGRVIAYNLLEFRYQGLMYLVGARDGSFLGHKIYQSVLDIPDPVELACLLVPAAAVPGVLRQCGQKGIQRVVIESGGFREMGPERLGLEEEVKSILKRYSMRMIGPNCIGIMNRWTGLALPFMPFKAEAIPGRVSIVSQSGGVGAAAVNFLAAEGIGFGKFASIGNKLDVNEVDFLEYLIRDDETDVIFFYLEGIVDGRSLMETAARSHKPIVLHKAGRGTSGLAMARSHSASLATDDKVVDEALRQCGIIRAYEQREALEMIKGFSMPPMKGNRLAIISRSGGHAVMAADAAEEFGFKLPPFPEDIIGLVQNESRAHVIQFQNPMDLGDLYNLPLYLTLAQKTLAREDIDGLIFIHNYQGILESQGSRDMIIGLAGAAGNWGKPLAVCVFTNHEELEQVRETVDIPIFQDPREAVRALSYGCRHGAAAPLPFSDTRPDNVLEEKVRENLRGLDSGSVPNGRLAEILESYSIPLVSRGEADSERATVDTAIKLGFPVVLKTAEPEVIHKSDIGGVVLNLSDERELRAAYQTLLKIGPRVLVQKMAGPGVEWLIGGRRDSQFGPVVVVGLGGIYVEVFKETRIRVGPITREEALRVIDECRGAVLLKGVRGQPRLSVEDLADILVRVSWLLADFPEITEIDLNPVLVHPEGAVVLDWRAVKQ